MSGTYNISLVALSIVVAIVASYTALDLAGRVTASDARARVVWLGGGAIAMGCGIWSMHFVGMEALQLPVPVGYDVPTVVLSLLVAILASGLALFIASRRILTVLSLLGGGSLMGLGIVAMHYIGMAAMRMPGMVMYRPQLVALSVVIAITASMAAVWLAFHLRRHTHVLSAVTIGSAVVMGFAISGMHYTAMAAAQFMTTRSAHVVPSEVAAPTLGGTGIGLATLLVLASALLTGFVDRRRAAQAALATERAELLAREREVRRTAEQATARLQAILNILPVGVVIADASGAIAEANAAARALLGSVPRGQHTAEYRAYRGWWPETGRPIQEHEWPLAQALGGQMCLEQEIEIETFDGERKVLLSQAVPIRGDGEAITGAVVAMLDITARKMLERRTHESLNALLMMAESLVHISTDESGIEDEALLMPGTAQRLVELTRSIIGCKRVSITGSDPDSGHWYPVAVVGMTPEQENIWRSNRPGSRLRDYLDRSYAERLHADGSLIINADDLPDRTLPYGICTLLLVVMRVGQTVVGVMSLDHGSMMHTYTADELVLARAISQLAGLVIERERLIRERARAQASAMALQEANRRMDEFLALASHELKTPLTSISGNIQVMELRLRRLAALDIARESDLLPLLDRAGRNLQRLKRLVDDLLDMSQIQGGHLSIHPERIDLMMSIHDVVDDLRSLNPQRVLRLKLPETPAVVQADATRVGQVLYNYILNALKYAPPDHPIDIGVDVEPDCVRVWVHDMGPGLSLEEQQHIWDRFYRVSYIGHQSGSLVGLGLGLFISRTIIEQHGGRVGVDSIPGDGSTFWFELRRVSID